jgi:hypothetical protein
MVTHLRDLTATLILKLSEHLPIMQSSHFLRMPHQQTLEPIEYLVQGSARQR